MMMFAIQTVLVSLSSVDKVFSFCVLKTKTKKVQFQIHSCIGVMDKHFEAKCERNTNQWTAKQDKGAEGSCDGLQKPANLEIFFLFEWKLEPIVLQTLLWLA